MLLAADAATGITDILLNLGLPGVVIIALGYWAKRTVTALEERCLRLEDDLRRQYQLMTDQMIPALTRATDITMEATRVLADQNRREERMAAVEEAKRMAVDELRRERGDL